MDLSKGKGFGKNSGVSQDATSKKSREVFGADYKGVGGELEKMSRAAFNDAKKKK